MMRSMRASFTISLVLAAALTFSSSLSSSSEEEALVPLFKHERSSWSTKLERYGIHIVIIMHESYTRVGVEKNGKAEIILHTPNSISFSPNGTSLVGDLAGSLNPLNPVLHLKHLLRRKFDDPEVLKEIEVSPHKIVNREGKPHIQFGDRVFSPEDLLAMFVRKVKGLAEDHFRRRIRKATFLVPGCFGYKAKKALREVAVSVGLEEPRVYSHHLMILCGHYLCSDKRVETNYLALHLGESSCELDIWSSDFEDVASITDEEINAECSEKTARALVERGLETARLNASDISGYVLTSGGGGERISKARSLLNELFEGKQAFEHVGLDYDEALTKTTVEPKKGEPQEFLSLDILPHSVGVETVGGFMTKTLLRNTVTSCSETRMFTTSRDNQSAAEIRVLMGEGRFAKECKEVGTLSLRGIKASPRGVPQIEITFEVDSNGLLKVKAAEKGSNVSTFSYYRVLYDKWYDLMSKTWEDIEDEESVDEEDRIMYLHSRISLSPI